MTESRSRSDTHRSTRNLHVGTDRSSRVESPIPSQLDAVIDETHVAIVNDNSNVLCREDLSCEDLTGFKLGQYELGRKLGQGGMGAVFVARHALLDKQFAIKFIASDLATCTEAAARFDQEIAALGKLKHPNIVDAIDAGSMNGIKYLVTELADGQDFEGLVEKYGPRSVTEACGLIRQVALGLAYAHSAGFVHRDVKPSNLILDRSNVVKILDFGLVCHSSTQGRLTEDGRVFGSLDFIAPEQAHDASCVDARGDIYGLGCTLLYLLSGEPPFSDDRYNSMAAKLKGHLFDRPEWFNRVPSNIPAELVNLLDRMTAKSPTLRIQTANEVADELGAFLTNVDEPTKPKQRTPDALVVENEPVPGVVSQRRFLNAGAWIAASLLAIGCVLEFAAWRNAKAAVEPKPTAQIRPPQLPKIVSLRDLPGGTPRKNSHRSTNTRVESR